MLGRTALLLSLIALLACSVTFGRSSEHMTPLVREVYESPVPADPRPLWDRVDDLKTLRRDADAELLSGYILRSIMQSTDAQQPPRPTTLISLLEAEERRPPQEQSDLRAHVLSLLTVNVDPSADTGALPTHNERTVQYTEAGHSIWWRVRDPREGYLRLAVRNNSQRNVDSFSVSAHFETDTDEINLGCFTALGTASLGAPRLLHDGESAVALCDGAHANSSSRRMMNYLSTADLVKLMEQVESGAVKLELRTDSISFPDDYVVVSAQHAYPYFTGRYIRSFPALGTIRCEDRNNCGANPDRPVIDTPTNPLVIFGGLFVIGCVLGTLLPGFLSAVLALAAFGVAVWAGLWLGSLQHSESLFPILVFAVLIGAVTLGTGLSIAAVVRYRSRRSERDNPISQGWK